MAKSSINKGADAPTSIALSQNNIFNLAYQIPSGGINILLALPRTPKTISGSNLQMFQSGWHDITLDGFRVMGNLVFVKVTSTYTFSDGIHAVQGTLTVTY